MPCNLLRAGFLGISTRPLLTYHGSVFSRTGRSHLLTMQRLSSSSARCCLECSSLATIPPVHFTNKKGTSVPNRCALLHKRQAKDLTRRSPCWSCCSELEFSSTCPRSSLAAWSPEDHSLRHGTEGYVSSFPSAVLPQVFARQEDTYFCLIGLTGAYKNSLFQVGISDLLW